MIKILLLSYQHVHPCSTADTRLHRDQRPVPKDRSAPPVRDCRSWHHRLSTRKGANTHPALHAHLGKGRLQRREKEDETKKDTLPCLTLRENRSQRTWQSAAGGTEHTKCAAEITTTPVCRNIRTGHIRAVERRLQRALLVQRHACRARREGGGGEEVRMRWGLKQCPAIVPMVTKNQENCHRDAPGRIRSRATHSTAASSDSWGERIFFAVSARKRQKRKSNCS